MEPVTLSYSPELIDGLARHLAAKLNDFGPPDLTIEDYAAALKRGADCKLAAGGVLVVLPEEWRGSCIHYGDLVAHIECSAEAEVTLGDAQEDHGGSKMSYGSRVVTIYPDDTMVFSEIIEYEFGLLEPAVQHLTILRPDEDFSVEGFIASQVAAPLAP